MTVSEACLPSFVGILVVIGAVVRCHFIFPLFLSIIGDYRGQQLETVIGLRGCWVETYLLAIRPVLRPE